MVIELIQFQFCAFFCSRPSQSDDRQSITVVKCGAHRFAGDFAGPIEILVVERMRLGHGKFDGITIDRCRRRPYQLFDSMTNARFQDVERAGDVHLERCTGIVFAMQQPHGCQADHKVFTLNGCVQNVQITDVATHRENAAARIFELLDEIVFLSAGEIIVNDHFSHVLFEQFRYDKTANESGAADDQYLAVIDVHLNRSVIISRLVEGLWRWFQMFFHPDRDASAS